MSDLVQMNLSVRPDLVEQVDALAEQHGWSKRATVTVAVEALVALMERHAATAAKASKADVGELFLRVARMAPAMLTDVKVEEARFSDGRPGLIVDGEWVFASDANGDLMVARKDGSQVGHVAHGRIEVLRDQKLAEVAALN